MTVIVALVVAVLFGTGTWLLLQRRLSRIIVGIGLMSHGVNLMLVTSGGAGDTAPLVGSAAPADMSDPLPHALVLTAIVIGFGVTAFLFALGYRAWSETHDDEVDDDVEDRSIGREQRPDEFMVDAEEGRRSVEREQELP